MCKYMLQLLRFGTTLVAADTTAEFCLPAAFPDLLDRLMSACTTNFVLQLVSEAKNVFRVRSRPSVGHDFERQTVRRESFCSLTSSARGIYLIKKEHSR